MHATSKGNILKIFVHEAWVGGLGFSLKKNSILTEEKIQKKVKKLKENLKIRRGWA
jgi:hypothetical protein